MDRVPRCRPWCLLRAGQCRGEISAQLSQPEDAHLSKGRRIRNTIVKDAGVRTPVIETPDGAEPFLAGCNLLIVLVRTGICLLDYNCYITAAQNPAGMRLVGRLTSILDLHAHYGICIQVDDALGQEAGTDD